MIGSTMIGVARDITRGLTSALPISKPKADPAYEVIKAHA